MTLKIEVSGSGPDLVLLHGERDTLVPPVAGAYLQRVLPRATLEVLAGTAHAPFIAQPQRIARRIMEFCGES